MTDTTFTPRREGQATAPPMDPRIGARRAEVEAEAQRERSKRWIHSLLLFLAAIIGWAVLHSPLMAVDRITIDGIAGDTDGNLSRQVLETSGITFGEPLVRVNLDDARTSVAALAWVDEVTLHRAWNGEITIHVSQRHAAALVSTGTGEVLLVDPTGRVLERSPAGAVSDVRTSTGARPIMILDATADAQPGQWIVGDGLRLLDIGAAMPADIAAAVRHIGMTSRGVSAELATFGDPGVLVWLGGTDDLDAKYAALRALIDATALRCAATVDLRAPNLPVLTRQPTCT